MEWVETTGRTVEEAKDAALDQLGVDEHDAEFEILEEPKGGLFGRLRSEARVRARVRPTRPRPKEDRRDRRRREKAGGGGDGRGGRETRPARAAEPKVEREAGAAAAAPLVTGDGDRMSDDVPLAEQAEVAVSFLEGLVERFGASADVSTREIDEETVEVAVTGEGLGLMVGPRGTTLAAIQELARTVVQRQTGGRNGRLLVDVAGYREARRDALARFTKQLAAQVIESGERRVLEPMSAADRKIVHDTANEIDGVTTTSEGEEPRRRVVIVPASAG